MALQLDSKHHTTTIALTPESSQSY